MNELVSVIIPVYNVEKYLGECLESVTNQTYKNIEILLINDGSTDGSGEVCDQYAQKDNRIKVLHKKNGGVSSARNAGLEMAQGDFITFIDADDLVGKEYVSSMYETSVKFNADIIFCKYSNYVNGKVYDVVEELPDKLDADDKDKYISFICRFFECKKRVFGSSCRTLFKKELIQDLRFEPKIKISEDLLFLVYATLKAKRFASVDKHLYFYRQSNESVSASYKKDYITGQVILFEKLKNIFDLFKTKESKRTFNINICLLCYYTLSNELKYKQKNRKENVNKVRKSALYKYFNLKNGLRIRGKKRKLKFLTVWFLTKFRVI